MDSPYKTVVTCPRCGRVEEIEGIVTPTQTSTRQIAAAIYHGGGAGKKSSQQLATGKPVAVSETVNVCDACAQILTIAITAFVEKILTIKDEVTGGGAGRIKKIANQVDTDAILAEAEEEAKETPKVLPSAQQDVVPAKIVVQRMECHCCESPDVVVGAKTPNWANGPISRGFSIWEGHVRLYEHYFGTGGIQSFTATRHERTLDRLIAYKLDKSVLILYCEECEGESRKVNVLTAAGERRDGLELETLAELLTTGLLRIPAKGY